MQPPTRAIRLTTMLTPFTLLVLIALLFAVLSMVFSQYPLLPVAVLLLAIALLINRG